MYGYIWGIYLVYIGLIWVFKGKYGYTWVYFGIYGCIWVYMDTYHPVPYRQSWKYRLNTKTKYQAF